jgi:cysteine-rich repeat protein
VAVDMPPFTAGGLGGVGEVLARFDPSLGDGGPPAVRGVIFSSEGHLTDTVSNGADLTIAVDAIDEDGVAAVVVETPDGAVDSQSTGERYTVTLADPCTRWSGGVPLSLVVRDLHGSELRHAWRPAFTCMRATCGNGTIDDGETCDDGNRVAGDGCNPTCTSDERCGNGTLDRGESCDDGSNESGDGCDPACRLEHDCTVPPSVCGNPGSIDWCTEEIRGLLLRYCGLAGESPRRLLRAFDRMTAEIGDTISKSRSDACECRAARLARKLRHARRGLQKIRRKALARIDADPCLANIAGAAAEGVRQADRFIDQAATCWPGCEEGVEPWWIVRGVPRRC